MDDLDKAIVVQILGPILGVIFSVMLIELILPRFRKKKLVAKQKLNNFYNIAYAFIKIREDFSIQINGEIHNKENCGFFHNFNFDNHFSTTKKINAKDNNLIAIYETFNKQTGIIFDEMKFFEFVAKNFDFIDNDLKMTFIEYFKTRGPDSFHKNIGCKDSKLIRLRREIENKIEFYYKRYLNITK
jgi:hypothetical protein